MATKFKNPVVVAKDTAKAPKIPLKDSDPEMGEVRSDSPDTMVSLPSPKPKYASSALFPELEMYGLRGKGKKSRKHKKRANTKTQKRRYKK